jgi:hypothetical protein
MLALIRCTAEDAVLAGLQLLVYDAGRGLLLNLKGRMRLKSIRGPFPQPQQFLHLKLQQRDLQVHS